MSTLSQALHHLKGNLSQVIPETLLLRICRDLGRSFRQRTLTPGCPQRWWCGRSVLR